MPSGGHEMPGLLGDAAAQKFLSALFLGGTFATLLVKHRDRLTENTGNICYMRL
jgi:hypothetical protein